MNLLNSYNEEQRSPKLIELGFIISVISLFVFWQLASVCLRPALLISYSHWEEALFQQLFLTSPLSFSLSLFLYLSLVQIIVMEIIRGAKPQTKESPWTHTWAKKNRTVV